MPLTETQIALCKTRNAKAQRELYELYKAKVMGVCRRYTRNKEVAEDIFQEAFIRVFQNIGQLNNLDNLEHWIIRTAVNTAINYYHKNKRHQYTEERKGFHQTNDEYELILSQFSDAILIKVINELPEGHRMVFNLYEIEGFSHAEIASFLHISEGTSRSQLNRAKLTLKVKLKAYGIFKYEKSA